MSWEALKEKGNALFKEKRYEDAIKFYEKALDINSSIEVLYSNKGTCKKCLKEYKDAINDYKKALELNPKNTKNMNRLASVYIITGQIGEAKLLQEKALNLEPNNSTYREQMATIEKILEDETKLNDKINEKKFEDAEEVCKRMIEKVSDFSELKLKYIKILIENVKLKLELNNLKGIEENLKLGAYSITDKEVINSGLENAYDLFPRLLERRKQLGGTLSGGEQQMLAMARALMAKPKIMLLDEPSMGLSPLLVKEIFSIIEKINKEGVSILLVEQNAKMALGIADKAYVIETGKIVTSGSGKQLLDSDDIKKAYLGG